MKFKIVFLSFLILVSAGLRFYELGKVPNGLNVDEADVGYNAYSIIKTGRDVYGKPFPVFFRSFDVNQPGFQVYASIPAIYLFGLNEFSVRFAAAVFGTLTVVLTFFLCRLLFPKQKGVAYIAGLLTTFSPWNIAISRAQLVTVEVIFLLLLFFTLFLIGLKTKYKVLLPLSFVFLALTIYAYHLAIFYLPFIVLLISIIYAPSLFKSKKYYLASLVIVCALSMPAVLFYLNPEGRNRFNMVSVLSPDITLPLSIKEIEYDREIGQPFSSLVHNRRFIYSNSLLDTYFDYFNLDYLFVNSSAVRYFYVNGVGLFYLLEFPFVLYGFGRLIKRREKSGLLILSLLFIGPMPAMVALGSPFGHRAPLLILSLHLMSAFGVYSFFKNKKFEKSLFYKPGVVIAASIYLVGVYFFLHQYFIHSRREFTSEFDNGAWFSTVRDVIPDVNRHAQKYEKVVFTWSQGKLVPAVYFFFYNKLDPRILQERAGLWGGRPDFFRQIYGSYGNVEFRPIDWNTDKNLDNTLFVGYPKEFASESADVKGKSFLPNGKVHFLFVEPKN